MDFSDSCCAHELVETQARRTPNIAAAIFDSQILTYRELDNHANRLAHLLRRLGAGPEVLVGLCANRSLDMVIGVLGILKSGAAYVPLDPAYPEARLSFMLNDAKIGVLLTQRGVADRLSQSERKVVYLEDKWQGGTEEDLGPPFSRVATNNLAYVIYTSGSTGTPKGVAVSHGPLCNLVRWQIPNSALGLGARTLQLASLSFDVSVQEMFSTWCAGGTLVLIPETLRRDPAALLDLINRESIERIFLPFSALQQLALAANREGKTSTSLREVVTAGEQLRITPEIVEWFKKLPNCSLYNQYGPTETHVVVTSHEMRGNPESWPALPPLGRPISNVRIHLLDEDRKPVPTGKAGEIYVGGVSLARGYLNRPELTAERFIRDPFSDDPNARLYRTGDVGRYLANGDIEFLGRMDHQVKIRGYRIELGEVEAALDRHPKLRQSAVIAREDMPGDKLLVAYIVVDQSPPSASELRHFLAESLPDYMLPSAFVTLETLPLTPNGKVDWKALPPPPCIRSQLAQRYVAPRNPAEQSLAAIWSDVLRMQPIGVEDNFFDLGGDSLKATRVLARVESAFGVRFPHLWLFEGPTVAQMAARLKALHPEALPSLAPDLRAVGKERVVPLSFGQEEIWVAARRHPEMPVYNEPFAIHIPEAVDAQALDLALNALIERHEILRTGFLVEDGHPVQSIHSQVRLRMEHVDLRPALAASRAQAAVSLAEGAAQRPFDLSRPPLLRAVLIQLGEREHRLYLVIHHIIADAVSVYDVLLAEVWTLYRAACKGVPAQLAPVPIQFADFARWQRAWLQGPALEKNLRYWEERLADAPALDLPSDRPRPAEPSQRGAFEPFNLAPELSEQLSRLAREQNVTLYMVLLAAFLTVLWRYTRQDDLVVGTAEAGRSRPELEPLLGYFVNTLVIRADLSGDPSFSELLQRVRAQVLEAQAHKDYPLIQLAERLQSRRHAGRELFRVAFVMEPSLPAQESRWTVSQMEVQTGTSKFDLTLELEAREGIIGRFEYASDLFDATRIRRLIGHFRTLLEAVAAGPQLRLSELPLLSAAERRQLLVEWNQTQRAYPRDECIHRLFAAQAARSPEAVALVCGERQLRYGELDARANQLAHHLRRLGVGPDIPVGVYGERSLETVTALLAVLKAGGAYVPLEPGYPLARLEFMLKDSGARVLLAQRGLPLPTFDGPVVVLEEDWPRIARESIADPAVAVGAEHLAYVMYTSGSTGIPKGVAVPHRAVLRLLCGIDYAELDSRQVFLLLAPLVFDASTFELWGALLHGGRCVVFPERVPSIQGLGRAIAEHGVNTLWLTAALFNAVIDEGPEILAPVRQLLTGGEALSPSHVRRALACLPGTRLINGYGPTEGTTFTCCYSIPRSLADQESSVPIGRPIANTRVYVLDEYLNPVPVGVPGELYIGGDGLARGYLNRPELTAERFVPDPFDPSRRLYRTGDRVRYLPDGNLEFLGRLDGQVKVRGYRIELGEIEAGLDACTGVRQSVVMLREDHQGNKRLVAYVVGEGFQLVTLRDQLRKRLPEYMVPSEFVLLDALPLTPNGKVDRAALPAHSSQVRAAPDGFVAPRDAIEVQLMRIWEELLGKSPIGMRDNFFELGGHSLLAIQLVDRVKQLFSYELPLDTLWYHRPSIEGIAGILREREGACIWSRAVPIKPEGSRSPIFCPPIAGGHLYFYDNLARHLSPEQPVYGLPAQGVDGRQPPHVSIEDMAKHAIGLMREVQPQGPYSLLGYCSGGVVAFEMARQLQAQGEDVAALLLIDSEVTSLRSHLKKMMFQSLVRGKGWRDSQERLYAFVLNAIGLPQLRRLNSVGESHRWAVWSYQPRPFGGRIILFRPENYEYSRDPMLGWGSLAQGGVEIHLIPGKHGDLVKEPGVQLLATALQRCLQ